MGGLGLRASGLGFEVWVLGWGPNRPQKQKDATTEDFPESVLRTLCLAASKVAAVGTVSIVSVRREKSVQCTGNVAAEILAVLAQDVQGSKHNANKGARSSDNPVCYRPGTLQP